MDRVSGRRRAHATLLHMLMVYVPCLSLIKSLKGVQGLSLCSSPSSEDGIISVCPATTVTLTCTASGVVALGWRNQNGAIRGFSASDPESMVIEEGPYTLTLVSVDNDDGDSDADLTSTLEVMVDDIANRTNISCVILGNQTHLVIYKIRAPSPPSNVIVKTENFQPENFSIIISWESGEDEVVDEYRILTNTTTQSINTTSTTVVLEGVYNIPLEIRVSAINCVGTSAEVTEEVFVAGCGLPSPPVNGSVGKLTSSRVGAQVTYSCDTLLVLVGETVATCSLPSLTWLPSSDDVTCVQPLATTSSLTTRSTAAPSSTPSIHFTSARSSIGVIAGTVSVSLLVGITVATLIVLVIVYKGRFKKRKVSRIVEDNCYGAQEMLMRPGSSTGTLSVSTSPPLHSPRAALPSYDVITTTGSTVPYYSHADPTTEASGNGSSSTVVYSKTNESMRRVVASHSRDDGLVTSYQPTLPSQYSTMGPTSLQAPQGEKYAELVFESNGGPPMPSLDTLVPPVKYTMVKPSNKPHPKSHPKSPRPDPEHRDVSQSAVGPDKHPLDQRITIDMAIQQLQQLTPYWWAVGEAAGMQRDALKEIQAHYKGDAKESFAEVMHQIFVPEQTTWTKLAGLCEGVGFADLATALLDSYTTGVLPVVIEEDEDTLRPPPTKPAPPIPPRGTVQDEDQDLPPSLPPPLSPDDLPPSLPPPLAPEDIPPSPPPPLAPEDIPLSVAPPPLRAEAPPPRPPKASKPPAVPPRH